MALGRYKKTPTEVKRYSVEYSHWLDTSEYVSSVSFATISTNTGTITLTADTIGASATSVSFLVSGGDDGQTYEVAVTMVTSAGQTRQDAIFFVVEAL